MLKVIKKKHQLKSKTRRKFSAKPKERGIFKDGFESEQVVNYSASNDLLPQTDENKNVDEERKSQIKHQD